MYTLRGYISPILFPVNEGIKEQTDLVADDVFLRNKSLTRLFIDPPAVDEVVSVEEVCPPAKQHSRPKYRAIELYIFEASLPHPKKMKNINPEVMGIHRSKKTSPSVGTLTISFHSGP